MLSTAGDVRANSWAAFSGELPQMGTPVLTDQASVLCGHWMQSRGPAKSDGWKGLMVKAYLNDNEYCILYGSIKCFSNWLVGLVGRVFANGPGDRGSIPGRVIPNNLKMVVDTFLLNTQQYKVHMEGKVEQSRERSSVVAIEKGVFWSPWTKGRQLLNVV